VCIRGPQEGSLAPADSFLSLDKPNVTLMALKAAEDGDGLIVRLNETEGKQTVVTATLPRVEILQAFGTDLVENDRAVLTYDAHSFTVALPAFGIATVRCRIGRRLRTARPLTRL
jgi:alpha-mannosidase